MAAQRRKPITNSSPGLSALFEALGEGLIGASTTKSLYQYSPHEKQLEFHKHEALEKLFIGGNRSGKSVAGCIESIWWLTKTHPYRQLPPGPIRGRVCTVDFLEGLEQIILPLFKQWLPKEYLIDGSWEKSYSKSTRVLTLSNGSTCDFLSYEQDVEKHAGTSRHFVWFDEEPPYEVFTEDVMRLIDTDGAYWLTMTPLFGMNWVFSEIYEKKDEDEHILVVEVNTGDNPHIKSEARSRIMRRLNKEERSARESGQFVEMGGLVFKKFSVERHVEPAEQFLTNGLPPKTWEWYMSLDSGWNNPTAILWHAVSPDGFIVTFDEHYASEMTVAEHSQVIKSKEAQWGKVPYIRTGDPATKQTREGTGTSIQQEYASHGIYLALENVPTGPGSVAVGIARMQEYLNPAPSEREAGSDTQPEPQWYISDKCANLIKEIKKLRWATYQSKKLGSRLNPQEAIAKKDDHACDSCRYFFTLMPDLGPLSPMTAARQVAKGNGILRYDEMLSRMAQAGQQDQVGSIDLTLSEADTIWYTESVS